MIQSVEMPEVSGCTAKDCGYNRSGRCHARAITVGGANDHRCDTHMSASRHTPRLDTAGVGACKVTACLHNIEFECQADRVQVGPQGDGAECLKFEQK